MSEVRTEVIHWIRIDTGLPYHIEPDGQKHVAIDVPGPYGVEPEGLFRRVEWLPRAGCQGGRVDPNE